MDEVGTSGSTRGGMRAVPLLLLPGHVCDCAVWEGVVPRLAGLADCRIPEFADETNLPDMAERVLARVHFGLGPRGLADRGRKLRE